MKKFTLALIISFCFTISVKSSDFYWVGGTGNWSDVSHWATTSGGTMLHTLPPSLNDNVYFDSNSGLIATDTVKFDLTPSSCLNFYCSIGIDSVVFIGIVNVYADLNLLSDVNFGAISLNGANNSFYTGNSYISSLTQQSAAGYSMQSDFYGNTFTGGGNSGIGLVSNNHNINAKDVYLGKCYLGTSQINAGRYDENYSPIVLLSDSCRMDSVVVNFIGMAQLIFQSTGPLGSDFKLNKVTVQKSHHFTAMQGGLDISMVGFAEINDIVTYDSVNSVSIMSSGGTKIGKLSTMGSFTFNSNFGIEIDTLFMNKAGKSIGIPNGDTLYINNELYAVYQTGVFSNISGGYLSKPSGTVCLKNFNITNNIAIGGAQFFADNSLNSGGNNGWQFAPCSNVSDVWPGDANYDLTVNNFDILNLGLAYNETGPLRASASLAYLAQPATDWNAYFQTAVNKKHADCDGDGTVSFPDTLAISQNYGLTHPARVGDNSSNNSFGAPLYFDVPTTSLQPGSVVTVPIHFGTATAPVNNLYGIAFTVDYDASLIQPNSVSINYTGSWLPTAGNYLHIERDFYNSNKIDMALTRTNHLNVSDYGTIANLVFTVANNASGSLQLGFSKIRAVSANELEIPVQANTVSVVTSVNSLDPENTFTVFPNPFKNQVAVINSNYKTGQPIEVFNIYGIKIYSSEFTSEKVLLDTETWRKGVYFIYTGGSVVKVSKTN